RPGGFSAAALVHRDVHEDTAARHEAEHLAGDELGGLGTRNEDGTDNQIHTGEQVGQVRLVRVNGVRAHGDVEEAHALEIHREDGDVRADAGGHAGGSHAGSATAEDNDAAGCDTGHAAKQRTAATAVFREVIGADDGG